MRQHTRAGRRRQQRREAARERGRDLVSDTALVPRQPHHRHRPRHCRPRAAGARRQPKRRVERRQRATAGAAHKHFRRGCGGGVADDRQRRAGAGVAPRKAGAPSVRRQAAVRHALPAAGVGAWRRRQPARQRRGGGAADGAASTGTRLAEHHEPRRRGARERREQRVLHPSRRVAVAVTHVEHQRHTVAAHVGARE